MIRFENVRKAYRTREGLKTILRGLTADFPRDRNLGIFGLNGAGKSTLIRMIAGVEEPDDGRIIRKGRISWPLGFGAGFHGSLTGADNARFVARIYGADPDEVTDFVADFAELGAYLYMPVRSYSAGMRARLAFGMSLAIDFDIYLIDEITEVGDHRFRERCRAELTARLNRARVVMVSHNYGTIRSYCDMGAVLENGELTFYDTLDEAYAVYRKMGASA